MELRERRLRWGSRLVAASFVLAATASVAILSAQPDPAVRLGRHLIAGALANLSLAVVEAVIALIPLRTGEKWAFAAALVPFLLLAVPMMLLDASYVSQERLPATLGPFLAGITIGGAGLLLCGMGIWSD